MEEGEREREEGRVREEQESLLFDIPVPGSLLSGNPLSSEGRVD